MHLWTHVELEEVVASFQQEYEHVMFFARTVLSSMWVFSSAIGVLLLMGVIKTTMCSRCFY